MLSYTWHGSIRETPHTPLMTITCLREIRLTVAVVSKSVSTFDPFCVHGAESNGAVWYLHKARFSLLLYVDQSTKTCLSLKSDAEIPNVSSARTKRLTGRDDGRQTAAVFVFSYQSCSLEIEGLKCREAKPFQHLLDLLKHSSPYQVDKAIWWESACRLEHQ